MWLILPRPNDDGSHLGFDFYSFLEGIICPYKFDNGTDLACKFRVIGTSKDRIMMEDGLSRVHALDPLTRTGYIFPLSVVEQGLSFGVYKKAILVQRRAGTLNEPVWAAVLRGGRELPISELAFAHAGAEEWTDLMSPTGSCFEDIATADDGKLYALDSNGEVFVFDLDSLQFSSYPAPEPAKGPELRAYSYCEKYLGVMGGEFILLRAWMCAKRPVMFEVFQMHRGEDREAEWVKVKDLSGHAIMLGDDGFVSLNVGEFPGVMADCIYFIDSQDGPGKCFVRVVNVRIGAMIYKPLSTIFAPWFWFIPDEAGRIRDLGEAFTFSDAS
ncbi:uncharacterized protein LOC144715174 [Wolffia australiana]